MTDTRSTGQEIQTQVLGAVRMSEEMLANAIKLWADTVRWITPSIPMPNLPYSDKLPKPEEFVAGAYDFAEQMFISQRKFAEGLLGQPDPSGSLLRAGSRQPSRCWAPLTGDHHGPTARRQLCWSKPRTRCSARTGCQVSGLCLPAAQVGVARTWPGLEQRLRTGAIGSGCA